jgi:hypothetical protein
MKMKKRALFLVNLMFILAACSAPTPQPTIASLPTKALPATAAPVEPTATTTATSAPTDTAAPTQTPTQTTVPTPEATATPAAAFDKLRIIDLRNSLGGYNLVIIVPGVKTAYDLKLNGKDYSCVVDAKVADRLFCQGLTQPPFDVDMKVEISDPTTKAVVYQGSTVLAQAILLKPTAVGWAQTNCPDRGKNVHCEMECRIAPNGLPCIATTCVDLCGAYFSVHTCPDMSMTYNSCNPEQWAQMKALYNIP